MHDQFLAAIRQAEAEGLVANTQTEVLSGLSGDKLVGALQRLTSVFAQDSSAVYLEVGVFQGLTLLSVANGNRSVACLGIDNFAEFDPNNQNQSIIKQRMQKLAITNAQLINKDYEDALESLADELAGRKIGVYFIDGPHDYRSQLMCLQLALPHLHPNCVILVDDSNYRHVRQANCDFLRTHPEFKLIFDGYTKCHPQNMTEQERAVARRGWWNGINILARDVDNVLPTTFPPTERSRDVFVRENELHALKSAEAVWNSAIFAQYLLELNLYRASAQVWRYCSLASKMKGEWSKRYRFANTYSADLPTARYVR